MSLVEYRQENGIGYITLNRPEKLNAITDDMALEINQKLYMLDDDPDAMVGILSGNGRAFSSGADVKERQLRPREELERLGSPVGRGRDVVEGFFRAARTKPVIAAVHGYVMGMAIRLSLQCELMVAAEDTVFQMAGMSRGLGGGVNLAMLLQRGAGAFAFDVMLTARKFSAAEAFEHGLVARLAPPGQHVTVAEGVAGEIMKLPQLGVRGFVRGWRFMLEETQVRARALAPQGLALSEDFHESALAFIEKRTPTFTER